MYIEWPLPSGSLSDRIGILHDFTSFVEFEIGSCFILLIPPFTNGFTHCIMPL